MKKSDKKTETEDVKPVEEVKSEEAKPEEAKPVEEPKGEQPASTENPAETAAAEKPEEAKAEPVNTEQDIKETPKKKSFFSNKRNIAVVACASAAVVALSLGLGLGLGLKKDGDEEDEPPVKTAFSAPTNVAVNESTISWTAVDNATNGYTLKFAESNKEMTLTVTSYNLFSDTSYLSKGMNTLSVKVNATDLYNASAYSATVTYTFDYTIPPVEEKFDAPVIELEGSTVSWTTVDGATSYTVKINDDETTTVNTNSIDLLTVKAKLKEDENTISVKVNAVGEKKASDYSNEVKYNYVDQDKKSAAEFAALVDGIDVKANDAEAKLTSAKTAYEALSAEAKTLAATAYAKLKEFDGKYFVSLVDKIGTVTEDSGAVIAAAVNYYDKVIDKENADVKTAKGQLDEKNSAYQHYYESYVADFGEKVNAITIEATSRGEVIDTAKAAIETADVYYNAQTEKVKAALAQLKITFDGKKATYATAVKAEFDGYTAIVDEAVAIVEAQSDLTALTEEKAAIDAYTLSNINSTAVEGDSSLQEKLSSIAEAITNWNTAISDAIRELTVTASDDDEADIVVAEEALAKFDNYAEYIKANTSVTAAKRATEGVLATAKKNIETVVDAIKTATEAAIANTEPNEDNFTALETQKTAIEGVTGAYAAEYLATLKIGDDGLLTAVEKAMETMLATVVNTEGGEAYSLTGATLKVTLFKTFYNFRNQKIDTTDGENVPKLEVDDDNETEEAVKIEQQFTKNDLNEYVAVISMNTGLIGAGAKYTVTVGSSSEDTSLKFGTIGLNPYFTNNDEEVNGTATGFKEAIVGDEFVMNFQAGCTAENYWLEVYNADALTIDGDFVKFSQMPLGKIDVTGKSTMPMEDFNRLLANNLSEIFVDKKVNVRFMIYGTKVDDEVHSFTAMNASVISEALEFSLTEADKYYKLSFKTEVNNFIGDTGASNLIVPMQMNLLSDFINETLTANKVTGVKTLIPNVNSKDEPDSNGNLDQYIGIKLEVKGSEDLLLHEEILPLKLGAFNFSDVIKKWSIEYYKAHRNDDDNKTFENIKMYISYVVLDGEDDTVKALKTYFPRSESKQLIGADDTITQTYSNATLTKQKLEMNVGQMDGLASGDEKTDVWAYGRWELAAPNENEKYEYYGLTVLIYEVPKQFDADVTVQNYDFFANSKPFATYYTDAFANMQWSDVNGAINTAWLNKAKAGETEISGTKSFVFLFQHKVNDAAYEAGYFDSDAVYVTTQNGGAGERTVINYTRNFDTPSGAQIKFDGDYITFLRENQPKGENGTIFDAEYGVQYIELEFKFGGTTKSAFLFVETGEGGARKIKMFTNTEKTGNELSCGSVNDSFIYNGGEKAFNNWVVNNYGIESFDAHQASFRTRIWHNGTAYIGTPVSDEEGALQYGAWSDSVNYNG